MTLQIWTKQTAIGPWTVVADDDLVVASGFEDSEATMARLPLALADPVETDDLGAVSRAVVAYLDGDLTALETISVEQPGTAFRQGVWRVMRQIPVGQTWSYTELATKAGHPAAVRAAASVCAGNQTAPFVPCHRVVRSDGTLGGYAYGLPVKQWLLAHEGSELSVGSRSSGIA